MTRGIRRVVVTAVALVTAVAVAAPNAEATVSTFTWGSLTRVATDVGLPDLTTVSCPTTTFCMGLDQDGTMVHFDGSTWTRKLRAFPPDLYQVSCTSATFCLATAAGRYARRWDGTRWRTLGPVPAGMLSCASPTFCVSAAKGDGQNGGYYAVWNGTGFGERHAIADDRMYALSCVAANSCIGLFTGGSAPGVAVFSLRFDGTSWSDAKTVGAVKTAPVLSCIGTFCLAASREASAVFDGSTWTPAGAPPVTSQSEPAPSAPHLGLSCASASFCALISGNGSYRDFAEAAVTVFNGLTWGRRTTLFSDGLHADRPAVSCVSATFCVAVTDGVTSTYSGSSWSAVTTIDQDAGSPLNHLSCATATFCVAAGANDARVWNGSSWAAATTVGTVVPPIDGDSYRSAISDVSCVSSTFCVASLSGQEIPLTGGGWARWDGTSWTTQEQQRTYAQLSVSCVSSTFCVSVGHLTGGGTERWAPSVFDGTSWTTSSTPFDARLEHVSCVSTTFCMAIGQNQFSNWDGTSWSPVARYWSSSYVPIGIACLTPTRCFAPHSRGGPVAQYTPAGWTFAYIAATAVSCSVGAACLAVGPSGFADQYRGKGVWSPASSVGSFGQPVAVSCPTASFCMATDDLGYATIGRAT